MKNAMQRGPRQCFCQPLLSARTRGRSEGSAVLVQILVVAGAKKFFQQQHVDIGLLAPQHH